jgi:hypothetical protein
LKEANVSQEAITLSHHLLQELRRAGRHPELSILLDQVAFAGKTGSKHCLVLELVEGKTLAGRISRGPIPVDEKDGDEWQNEG